MDRNFSPSASGQLNLVKIENNYTGDASKLPKKDVMRKIRESIDPSGAAMVYIEAAKIVAEGLGEIAERLVNAGTPRELAIYQAYEIYRGAEHLSNITKSIGFAEESLDEDASYTPPSQKFVSDYMRAVEDVNEEEVLRIFGKLLAGEMESPGSVSRHTMSVLSSMGKAEAEAFRKVCGLTTYFNHLKNDGMNPDTLLIAIKLDENCRSYNQGELTVDEVGTLTSLGLIDRGLSSSTPIGPKFAVDLYTERGLVRVSNRSDDTKELTFLRAVFQQSGIELAKVCGIGDNPFLKEAIIEIVEEQGFEAKEVSAR